MKAALLRLVVAVLLSPFRSRAESAPAAAEPDAQAAAQKWLALVDAGQAAESRLATAAPMRDWPSRSACRRPWVASWQR